MSRKTIPFARPASAPNADAWVEKRAATARVEPGPTKRFTVDVPADLHRRVKLGCVERNLNMTDLLRDLLEREFPSAPANP